MIEDKKISPEQKHVLACVGFMILRMQIIEKLIHLCVSYVFPKTPLHKLSVAELLETTDALRERTVGNLLHELRKRVGIDETFENVLFNFLKMRNTIVHNTDQIPGWSLDSQSGIAVAHRFLSELLRLSGIVEGVFMGIIGAWQEKNQMEIKIYGMPKEFYVEIDVFYKPLASRWFFEKE
jgi:hypothetical protein